jgi:DNA polymerase/3'-5' exonuclease PolX
MSGEACNPETEALLADNADNHVGKVKYPRAAAIAVARELCTLLEPCCARIMVAGSLRRRKAEVGDVEILYLPNMLPGKDPGDLFGREVLQNAAEVAIEMLVAHGVLEKRLNVIGRPTWGPQNKLARHVKSGIPVDLFAANHENWWNMAVCRTGPPASNVAICEAAIEKGWKWNPYAEGFSRPNPERVGWLLVAPTLSEEGVFAFVGLPFLPPEERR